MNAGDKRAPMKEILYIHMAALGDAIMASPALSILKRSFPEARITVVARSQSHAYFKSLPEVSRVIRFVDERFVDRRKPWRLLGAPAELFRLWREVRSTRWDASLQWRSQLPDTLLTCLAWARHRVVGFQKIHRRPFFGAEQVSFVFTDSIRMDGDHGHLVEALALPSVCLLASDGRVPVNGLPPLSYPISSDARIEGDAFLKAKNLSQETPLAMVSISAKSEFNRWSDASFAAVADGLAALGCKVILSGIPEHKEREAAIISKMTSVPIRSTGILSMGAVAAVLERCSLLVALNTGITHVAAALQIPVVVLNGRDGSSITPWHAPHVIVTKNPFYPRRHPDEKEWPNLVPLIAPEDALRAAQELFRSTAEAPELQGNSSPSQIQG